MRDCDNIEDSCSMDSILKELGRGGADVGVHRLGLGPELGYQLTWYEWTQMVIGLLGCPAHLEQDQISFLTLAADKE